MAAQNPTPVSAYDRHSAESLYNLQGAADAEVIAKLLDEALVPTAEYVANLESAMSAATAELAAFREDAAARREAESKVQLLSNSRNCCCPMRVVLKVVALAGPLGIPEACAV